MRISSLCLRIVLVSSFYTQAFSSESLSHKDYYDQKYFTNDCVDRTYQNFEIQLRDDKFSGWSFAAWTKSIVNLFVATKEEKYFIEALRLAELVMNNRDSNRSRVDQLRNKSMAAWGRFDSNIGLRSVWAVEAGVVMSPLAELYAEAYALTYFKNKYGTRLSNLRNQLFTSLHAFDGERRYGLINVSGRNVGIVYYMFPLEMARMNCGAALVQDKDRCSFYKSQAGLSLPFNMYLSLGNTFLQMYKKTQSASVADFLSRMFNHFYIYSGRLNYTVNGQAATTWNYMPNGRTEDVSHANLVVEFITEFYKNITHFKSQISKSEYTPLINAALQKRMATAIAFSAIKKNQDNYELTWYVNGQNGVTDRSMASCRDLIRFSVYQSSILTVCTSIIRNQGYDSAHSLSELVRWQML